MSEDASFVVFVRKDSPAMAVFMRMAKMGSKGGSVMPCDEDEMTSLADENDVIWRKW